MSASFRPDEKERQILCMALLKNWICTFCKKSVVRLMSRQRQTRGRKHSKDNVKLNKEAHSSRDSVEKTWSSGKDTGSNELIVYVREFDVFTMKDIHQPPVCRPGVARQVSPRESPQFVSVGPDGDRRFFSCLEPEGAMTFFQLSSPGRDKGRPSIKKHWDKQSCFRLLGFVTKCSTNRSHQLKTSSAKCQLFEN